MIGVAFVHALKYGHEAVNYKVILCYVNDRMTVVVNY